MDYTGRGMRIRLLLLLARLGWNVVGMDLSWPMLCAAASRTHEHGLDGRLHVVLAPMECIPAKDRSFDLVIAHGIWNLARSAAQFRRALDEAARVAKPGAGLFVFTFSRNTLPVQAAPVAGAPGRERTARTVASTTWADSISWGR